MYISGHLEILDNILAILPNDYFNHEYENVNVYSEGDAKSTDSKESYRICND